MVQASVSSGWSTVGLGFTGSPLLAQSTYSGRIRQLLPEEGSSPRLKCHPAAAISTGPEVAELPHTPIYAVWLIWSGTMAAHAQGLVISLKAVKSEPGRCTTPPKLELARDGQGWQILTGEAFHGENDWEVYWNLEHPDAKPALPRVRVSCPGVKVARVIVGRTDVEFQPAGDRLEFDLVRDTSRGQLIQTILTDPNGGLPIDLHHNWEMRRAGKYRDGPWPEKRIAAHNNYLFAAREALRIMGGFGQRPEDNLFDGRIVLEGFETAFTRGHADYPPHFHIMLYPPGYTGAQVPHFYMDDEGNVESNAFVAIGVEGSGRTLGPGEWCSLRDRDGVVGLELMIRDDGGLSMRKAAGGDEFILRGARPEGAAKAVGVYRGEELLLTASVTDDAERGVMAIDIAGHAAAAPSIHERIEYDPFTGRLVDRQPTPEPR
jgi:hypothetical protein